MRDKKARIKTILAFGTVLIVVMVAWLLNQFDCSGDVLPNENTTINLYGEMHGYKETGCYGTQFGFHGLGRTVCTDEEIL